MIHFLGGLALFLYGQFLLERSLQDTSRRHLRGIINLFAKYKISTIFLGSILAIGMQSSTIAVITLVDLVNIGVLNLGRAIGIFLGASIGTTITLQALSFNVEGYALWFILIGFLIYRLSRNIRGLLILGLGFMFYGLWIMKGGIALFKATSAGSAFVENLFLNPFQNMIGAFILTVISQSNLAGMAVGITLMREGELGLANSLPIILGAHIGAGVLPLFYSWRVSSSNIGRQLGIANFIYRVAGVIIFIPLFGIWAKISQSFSTDPVRGLANAHTVFTVITVGVFMMFIMPYSRLIRKIMPQKESFKKGIKLDLLQDKIRVTDEIFKLLNDSIKLWETENLKEIEGKRGRFCFFQEKTEPSPFSLEAITNLEKIGNIIGISLTDLSRKRIREGIDFTIEGLNEIQNIHRRIIDEFKIRTFDGGIESLISASFTAHAGRMQKGFRETKETSSLHTDALTILKEIHWHIKWFLVNGGNTLP